MTEAKVLSMLHRLKPFGFGCIRVEGNFGHFTGRFLIGNAIIRQHAIDLRKCRGI